MLTFHFTGAGGRMTEYELLTAGMTGKQIRFLFSPEWDGLKKVAVYRAGDISCIQEDIQELDTIPSRALSKSLRRLYVGVYGVSEDGRVAIPTVLVPGPFIHIGASTEESPGLDPSDWAELEQALAETVRFTPQNLTAEQMAQARANIGASEGGLSAEAAALLLTLLRKAVYTEDLSQTITALEEALRTPEIPEEPQTPETVYYAVSCNLEHVTAQPASAVVAKGQGCTVTLMAEEGYLLESVTVTMGGSDITGSAYANGVVKIPAVTGNVVITAKAVIQTVEPEAPGGILYVAASVFDNVLNRYVVPSIRMSAVTTEVVADIPFPQNGSVYAGDLYLLPVPAGTNVLKVTSPGIIGGPQFFTLADGVYTCKLDAGWLTEDGFEYAYTADAYDFVAINFKNSTNTAFFTADYDTSGMAIEFAVADGGGEDSGETEGTQVPITLSLTKISATNNQRTIAVGERYLTTLVPEDGYVLTTVTVTMGGQNVTEQVCSNGKISIPAVTGAVFVTAVAMRGYGDIVFMPASASADAFNYKDPKIRMCTAKLTGEVPFPQDVAMYSGDLYPVDIPADATAIDVACPGLIGGVQFYDLVDGAYVNVLDAGWQTQDSFRYSFGAGTYGYCIVNFKNPTNTEFFTSDYDTSGVTITFQ